MVISLVYDKIKSDCYYSDLDLGLFPDRKTLDEIEDWAKENNIALEHFNLSTFKKSKYDYTEDELLELDDVDFEINEVACSKRVLAPDGKIYYCPGFIELKEPICNFRDFNKEKFKEHLEDFYFKKLWMCTQDDPSDIRRMCTVKHRCNKKMCYYLNQKITGEKRFPFSRFCAIKELKHKNKMNTKDANIIFIMLNSLTKLNEAILSLGSANPDFTIRNRANQLVKEVNENIESIISKIEEGEKNGNS